MLFPSPNTHIFASVTLSPSLILLFITFYVDLVQIGV
jgi:hypothetical protein